MPCHADSESKLNRLSAISNRSAAAKRLPPELAFGWPVSDAIADILERVEVVEAKSGENVSSLGGKMTTQELESDEDFVSDQIFDPEDQTGSDQTNTHIRRFVMDSATVVQPIRTAESVRETINQDGAVLLDIKQGVCFSMNPVGARIWEMLKNECPLDRIASSLEQEFKVPRTQIEADIADFVAELRKRNLILGNDAATPEKRGWLSKLLSPRSIFGP